ncbi:GspF2 [Desulforapulum autotrophicum HRM2]|uniref:GspF2 n=1 Tax=Desulforapulum autotrophicum (strain ATCC 43914 / DSM 3382 / VKM B-1955 / HRM2) TaxID=177437 RepID=C0QK82_DESAH|nr:type II secretion system F family protein [Desulforapulum autotrophicum]ACN16108.1 GspF2 [Desulforapulum autotrophicum HRM2]
MTLYSYKASDSSGKIMTAAMEADSEGEVVSTLQKTGLIPIRISESGRKTAQKHSFMNLDVASLFHRVSTKDVMLFTQDLTALLEAGLPVDRSLKILVESSENPKFKLIVKDILKLIEGGSDLSEAMGRYPEVFSKFYVNMVKAGEVGGILEMVLERLGIFLETSQELTDYIKSALVYPLFLLGVGGLSIIVLMTFVIPKFAIMFADMGNAIPLSTKMLLVSSDYFRHYWWAMLIALFILGFVFNRVLKRPGIRLKLDVLKVKTPVVGDLVKKIEVGRISRTLGTLSNSGVPILDALLLVRDTVSNKMIADAMNDIFDRVKEGEKLSISLGAAGIFPSLAIQMIKVGEETGKLSDMLLRIADNYEKVVKNLVKRVTSLMEPAMILLMGVVVGFIVVSMLMAIFSMNDMPL